MSRNECILLQFTEILLSLLLALASGQRIGAMPCQEEFLFSEKSAWSSIVTMGCNSVKGGKGRGGRREARIQLVTNRGPWKDVKV